VSGAGPERSSPTEGGNDPTGAGYVAEAAHELRAPVSALVAAAETLDSRWDQMTDHERRLLVSVLLGRSRRLARLVVDLLDLSRWTAGGFAVAPVAVRLAPHLRAAVGESGVADVAISCPDEVTVTVDPEHLRRMLVNLLANARQHGMPPVVVEADTAGNMVELRVADRGAGVTGELVPRLFQRFSRAAAGPEGSPGDGGAGLGLAIVAGLARRAGGDAFYRPNPGGGAVFGVRLPAG
jgi:two-component system sensor histidine kinase MtrB